MSKFFLIPIFIIFILFISCSDDIDLVNSPNNQCYLSVNTDSSTQYTEFTYFNGKILKRLNYNFVDGQKGDLQSVIEFERNILNELKSLKYYNGNNILEAIDSLEFNGMGQLYEVVTFNNKLERVKRVYLIYDHNNNIIEERIFDFNMNWIIKIENTYIYDDNNRVITSIREQKTTSSPLIDTVHYTYDDMVNVESMTKLYTPFKKNNIISEEKVFYLNNGTRITELINYEYQYNEKGYPISSKKTTTSSESTVFNYYDIKCSD